MKKITILLIVIGLILVGCSQEEEIVSNEPVTKINSETKMEYLDLKEANEKAIFNKAVIDSTEVSGIVNMANPQYKFIVGEESYILWITKDSGTIMNTKDTNTIYSLSNSSVREVYEFIIL